jgi:methionyl-tRNA formyltransferase
MIFFAGNGHGAIVALKSLQQEFKHIEIITNDRQIIKLARKKDYLLDDITKTSAELGVCAGYHKIIPKKLLKNKTIINTHPSLLPKYRGLHSLVWAMLNFEKKLGFTIHLMNKHIDDGDIISQYKIRYNNETSQEIMDKFDQYIEKNLGIIIKKFINKKIIPTKQDKTKATWVPKRNLEDCIIDFSWDYKFIKIFFKALVKPYPLPMIKIKNELFEVNEYEFIKVAYYTHLGRVVNIEDSKAFIKTKDGLLVINELVNYNTQQKFKASEILKLGMRL